MNPLEYTVERLARLSGVSARTLRYYDQIGLLPPAHVRQNGYRIYGAAEVDRLQHILFYREMGLELGAIKALLEAESFDPTAALTGHLTALRQEKARIEALIATVDRTLLSMRGETPMTDKEKFAGFKEAQIAENEKTYGAEIRVKYGEEVVNTSNEKYRNLTPAQYAAIERLSGEVNATLKEAATIGDPAGEMAQTCCDLHRRWLCSVWPDGLYTPEAHLGLAQMYCDDERFRAYYEAITPGGAEFLRAALEIYYANRG